MSTIFDLPLFPLGTVLFPGMPVTLHVFEARYKEMVNRCVADNAPFGVVLIKSGAEAERPLPAPYAVGCTAKIVQVHHLDPSRMNIVAVGRDRFRCQNFKHEDPYWVAEVQTFPFVSQDAQVVLQEVRQLRPWVECYLSILSDVNELEFEPEFLPEGPLALAFMAAHLLQVPLVQKQALLETVETLALVRDLRDLYRREVALLRAMVSREEPQGFGMFSLS